MTFLYRPTEWTQGRYAGDPTLDEVMSDPLIRLVMKADGVDPQALETALRRAARVLEPRPTITPPMAPPPERCLAC